MRKLAKVVMVDDVKEHGNADALEIAVIGGWQCCVKKGEFVKNSLAVYFEVDSLLPLDNPVFEFLTGRNERELDGKRYSRIKTMKLRGELSQGLLLPLGSFPFHQNLSDFIGVEVSAYGYSVEDVLTSLDLTSLLEVIKYEPKLPAQLVGKAKGNFPSFIPKTDQERVQNIKKAYEKAVESQEVFEVTYKLDGSSFTAYAKQEGDVILEGVCSRNLELKLEGNEENTFVKTYKDYRLDIKLHDYTVCTGRSLAVQGEMVGPGIQNNFEGLDSVQLYIYNIYDIDAQKYLLPDEARMICEELDLDYVPIFMEECTLPPTIEDVLIYADGESGLNGKYREGLVFKSTERDFSFKVISNRYLLNEK